MLSNLPGPSGCPRRGDTDLDGGSGGERSYLLSSADVSGLGCVLCQHAHRTILSGSLGDFVSSTGHSRGAEDWKVAPPRSMPVDYRVIRARSSKQASGPQQYVVA